MYLNFWKKAIFIYPPPPPRWLFRAGADRYVLFCGPMFVPALVPSQPDYKPTIWGRSLYFTEIYERTMLFQCSILFLRRSLHVCVATSVSIRTNFKSNLIYFPAHTKSLSHFVSMVNNFKPTITFVS